MANRGKHLLLRYAVLVTLQEFTDEHNLLTLDALATKVNRFLSTAGEAPIDKRTLRESINDLNEALEHNLRSSSRIRIEAVRDILGSHDLNLIGERDGPGSKGYCYGISQLFTAEELELLSDASYRSKSLSQSERQSLGNRIRSLGSQWQGIEAGLTGDAQSLADDQPDKLVLHPTTHQELYRKLRIINGAIADGLMISFQYCRYTADFQLEPYVSSHSGTLIRTGTPRFTTCSEGRYYLRLLPEEAMEYRTYRVDRMVHVKTLDLPGEPLVGEDSDEVEIEHLKRHAFDMYAQGELIIVTLRVQRGARSVIVDKLGVEGARESVRASEDREGVADDDTVLIDIETYATPTFFAFVAQAQGEIVIEGPEHVCSSYRAFLARALSAAR